MQIIQLAIQQQLHLTDMTLLMLLNMKYRFQRMLHFLVLLSMKLHLIHITQFYHLRHYLITQIIIGEYIRIIMAGVVLQQYGNLRL